MLSEQNNTNWITWKNTNTDWINVILFAHHYFLQRFPPSFHMLAKFANAFKPISKSYQFCCCWD